MVDEQRKINKVCNKFSEQKEAQNLKELQGEISGMMYSCHANSILDLSPAGDQAVINVAAERRVSFIDIVYQ